VIALMPKLVKGLKREYKRNESLRENCDYQIMNWSFTFYWHQVVVIDEVFLKQKY
jgi:hypothetical protein